MAAIQSLLDEFSSLGWVVDGPVLSNNNPWLIISDYEIPGGRYSGRVVKVAFPVPKDWPNTPPGGLFVSPNIVPASDMGSIKVHNRRKESADLPGEWQYWSRPIPGWKPSWGARRLVSHWNAVMCNV